jgi:hypothetical protein
VYTDGSPWRLFELKVPTDKRILFTRSGPVPGTDPKTYDMGTLHVSTEACADGTAIGYLEVSYDIELLNKATALQANAPTSSVTQFYRADFVLTVGVPTYIDFNGISSGINPNGIINGAGYFQFTQTGWYLLTTTFFMGVDSTLNINIHRDTVGTPTTEQKILDSALATGSEWNAIGGSTVSVVKLLRVDDTELHYGLQVELYDAPGAATTAIIYYPNIMFQRVGSL